jgi:flagellar hook-associated protein 2
MSTAISGLVSGFDWNSLIDQLIEVERAPEKQMQTEQSTLANKNNAFSSLKTQLSVLQNRVNVLKDSNLYDSRTAASSDSSLGTATVSAGSPIGTFNFNVINLATSSVLKGKADVGKKLSSSDDVSGVTLSTAGFSNAVTAGTFTVNGKQVTIATSDTLKGVFDKISAATSGDVTATYSSADDKITLQSGTGSVVLGSAADTSNFLQVTKLANNGTGTVTSSSTLGGVKSTGTLSSANFSTTISDGGSGTGKFKVNGVEISFNVSSDSLTTVMNRINSSTAGVTASYDRTTDRLQLTNKSTGDLGVALEDVTGNFLAASGLLEGTLTRGDNLKYTINGGGELISQSNMITEDSSGISGLSVSVKDADKFSITVASDTTSIRSAIVGFVTEYNSLQGMINTQTASTTDAKGKVTAGVLADDPEASQLNSTLRSLMTGSVSGLSGTIKRLESLGFTSNGNDDSLSTSSLSGLDDALLNNLSGLKDFFTNSSTGLAVQMGSFVTNTIGDNGTLVKHQNTITSQISDIDDQIADMEKRLANERQNMEATFVAMEQAQASLNQQLTYLMKQFA